MTDMIKEAMVRKYRTSRGRYLQQTGVQRIAR